MKTGILSIVAAYLDTSHPHWSLDSLEYLTATESELSNVMKDGITVRPLLIVTERDLGTVLLGVIMHNHFVACFIRLGT